MKKVLVIIFISSSLTCFAQEQYKPEKGSFTTELQFSPFAVFKIDNDKEEINYSSGPISMDALKLRYFISEKVAWRLSVGLNFDNSNSTRDIDENYEGSDYKTDLTGEVSQKTNFSTFSVATGFERHFGNWERLSVYLGGEIFCGVTSSKGKIEQDVKYMHYTKKWGEDYFTFYQMHIVKKTIETKNCEEYYDDFLGRYMYIQNSPMFFGGNLLLGMDFYVYNGLYLGVEFGLGYTFNKFINGSYNLNTVTKTTQESGNSTEYKNEKDKKLEDKITSSNFGFRYNPMIRLGWRF